MQTESIPDALADALGKIIAGQRAAWRREWEAEQAGVRQAVAELRQSVAEYKLALHELQQADHKLVAERVALLKDGEQGLQGESGLHGKDGAPGERGLPGDRGEKGEPGDRGERGNAGERGEKGERGVDGAAGKFVAPKEWNRGIHYESSLVTHQGATFCAKRDTAEQPPHDDWSLVAAAGKDAPVGEVCGLHDEARIYKRFDLVAFNGCEWRAKRDNPGPMPGDGWALSAKQGKRGDKGERGDRGEVGKEGKQGPAGISVVERKIEGFTLIDTMSDGSIVVCDIRPAFERYHGEVL